MGVAIYPVVEGCEEPWVTNLFSKHIGGSLESFVKPVKKLKLNNLNDFCLPDASFIEEFDLDFSDEEWFDPRDAILTVEAMISIIEKKPRLYEFPLELTEDLKDLRFVLNRALESNFRFRLEISV